MPENGFHGDPPHAIGVFWVFACECSAFNPHKGEEPGCVRLGTHQFLTKQSRCSICMKPVDVAEPEVGAREDAIVEALMGLRKVVEDRARFPPEDQLAVALGVTRDSVRRGFERLARLGLVKAGDAEGVWIKQPKRARTPLLTPEEIAAARIAVMRSGPEHKLFPPVKRTGDGD
jgi:hypothetical protein